MNTGTSGSTLPGNPFVKMSGANASDFVISQPTPAILQKFNGSGPIQVATKSMNTL